MGIFATRPEEPFEWAGLPSEPARPESDAERLGTTSADLSALVGTSGTSIAVPVPPSHEDGPSEAPDPDERGEG